MLPSSHHLPCITSSHHLVSALSSLSLALPLSLCVWLQAIFLICQIAGNYSVVWEAETTSSLTRTCCDKSTLFSLLLFLPFFLLFWRELCHLDPTVSSVHLAQRTGCQTHLTATYTRCKHNPAQTHGWSAERHKVIISNLNQSYGKNVHLKLCYINIHVLNLQGEGGYDPHDNLIQSTYYPLDNQPFPSQTVVLQVNVYHW